MKMKTILASALAALMLSACSKEEANFTGNNGEIADIAYLSLKVKTEAQTKASEQNAGDANEKAVTSLYLFTFDNAGNIIGVPGTNNYYYFLSGANATTTPEAFRISAVAAKMLVIANPGSKLKSVLENVNAGTTFTAMNAAITSVNITEINPFTMINSGVETGLTAGQKITNPLLVIDPTKIEKVSDHESASDPEQAAKDAAEGNRMDVKIERLASKLQLKVKDPSELVVKPAGATFAFGNWTVDALNTTFYPFAEKTILSVAHNGTSYANNFYTQDPNFTGTVGAGIDYTVIDNDTYDPILVSPYNWMASQATAYTIENTMAAAEQKFGNATRVVIKGTYYPETGWNGDWFSFAYENYETLADLQAAYDVVSATNLRAACDKMYNKIKAYADLNSLSLDGTDFSTLTVGDLAKIPNGGEVIKDGRQDVIRWYQNGLNYYYYEIRHDNETNVEMAFGKYGVVRNNWYSLTLGTVNGAGTPWYPDINNPGPGDPDPTDPIDESAGYLGIEIEIAPWIIWDREIDI